MLFTGYISDDLLRQYFVYADAFIFPSLYEGFGLPPLEAMACGCPVAVSSIAAMPEICKDFATYFDPYDEKEMAEKLLYTIANKKNEFLEKCKIHAMGFDWDSCCKAIERIIEKMLKDGN